MDNSMSTCYDLLEQVSQNINVIFFFLHFIKSQCENIKDQIHSQKSVESVVLNQILRQYSDLLTKIKNLLEVVFLYNEPGESDISKLFHYMLKYLEKIHDNSTQEHQIRPLLQENTKSNNFTNDSLIINSGLHTSQQDNTISTEVFTSSNLRTHFNRLSMAVDTPEFSVPKEVLPSAGTEMSKIPSQAELNMSDLKESDQTNEEPTKLSDKFIGNNKEEASEEEKNLVQTNSHEQHIKGIEVSVEHVHSPSEFYVLFSGMNVSAYKQLQAQLKSVPVNLKSMNVKKTLSHKQNMSQKMSKNVLYYSICDETWLRAEVLDWCLQFDDDLVIIFLTDIGETKCVSIGYLQSMPEDIRSHPVFLKRCHLTGICPKGKREQTDITKLQWPNNAVDQMRVWIETSKQTLILIDTSSSSSPLSPTSLSVTLWVREKNKSINQLLIDQKLADELVQKNSETHAFENDSKYVTDDFKLNNWNPMKEDYEAYNNVPELDIMNPASIIYGYIGQDSTRICQQFASEGKCYKGKACRKEHKTLNPSGFTIDQEKVFINTFNSHKPLKADQVLNIEVTEILSINNFCCLPKDNIFAPGEETLEDLNAFMNDPQNVRDMNKLTLPPSDGQIIAANYSIDDGWYRAQVLQSEPENDKYTVLFVDYGNIETVPFSRIRAIEPKYLHLPFQCIRCCIYGIEQPKKEPKLTSTEEISHLWKTIKDRDLKIKVVTVLPGNTTSLLVHLYDKEGNDIAKELVEQNYATNKEELFLPEDAEVLPG